MLEVTVQGAKEVETLINKLADDIESNIELNKELSTTLSQKASSMAPKLTGALASSVIGNASGQKAQILAGSAAVPYAGVQEYGWPEKNIKAQPYLRPAVFDNMGYIIEKYNDSIKENIRKYDLN
jgi:hypothetical protein